MVMNNKVILSDIDWDNIVMEPLETTGDYEPAEIHDKRLYIKTHITNMQLLSAGRRVFWLPPPSQ